MKKCFLVVSYSDQAGLNAPKSCSWEKLAPQHSILVRIFFSFVIFFVFLGGPPCGSSQLNCLQLQNIGCQAYLTFDLLQCELDQAGEENWNQMDLRDGTKTRFMWYQFILPMDLCNLVVIQQTNTNVKNTNNSHYKWLEMTINANITENKVKSMSDTRTQYLLILSVY